MLCFRALVITFMLTGLILGQRSVSFRTQDGGLIYADLYGSGNRAVVLVHGGRFNKESWKKQASDLAAEKFLTLSIDFRGEGKSRCGKQEQSSDDGHQLDVLGAIHYLRTIGARSVSVIGASMGGDYAAKAAEAEPEEMDKLVLLASGAYTPLIRFKGRKLFIIARDDANAEGLRLPKIQAQYEKALEPKKLVILDGSAHAQFLFETAQGDRVMREILTFLSAP